MIDIPADKAKHAALGAAVGCIGGVAGFFAALPMWIVALGAAAVAGAFKEFWDSKHGGSVEFADFVATALGGAFVAIPLAIPLMV